MSAPNDPLASIRWWWRDWRASTARAILSPIGRLAYLELLFASHGEPDCVLPSDDRSLAALAGLRISTWRRVKQEVLANFTATEDGRYVNEKMQAEWRKAVAFREDQRRRGRLGALSTWGEDGVRHGARHSQGADGARHGLPSPSPSPSPSSIPPTPLTGAPPAPAAPSDVAEPKRPPKPRTDPLALALKNRLGCGARIAADQVRALRQAGWDAQRIQEAIETHARPGVSPWNWTAAATKASTPKFFVTEYDRAQLDAARKDYQ